MTLTVYLPTQLYEQRLRGLAAWWCLGSSALRPDLLLPAGRPPRRCSVTPRLSPSGTQYRLARALLDYLSGIDPSAVGLVQTLLSLIPGRRPSRGGGPS